MLAFDYLKSEQFPLIPFGELTFGDPFQESGVEAQMLCRDAQAPCPIGVQKAI